MNTTEIHIEGMSCGHCVASVTKALQAIPGVEGAEVSLPLKKAVVRHEPNVSIDALKEAIEDEGYAAQAA